MSTPATFAAVFAALFAGHHVGDYWVQTGCQAQRKGLPGWPGRRACAAHVTTYTATLFMSLCILCWWTGLDLPLPWIAGGLAVSAVTHYFADRRKPLEWVCWLRGNHRFWETGSGLATGASFLDQAWHIAWLFVSALVVSGPPH